MTDVTLVFPPLVETSFGSYYPSTAVLSGFLEANAVSTRQVDLNEAFAEHLLSKEFLHDFAAGAKWLDSVRPSREARRAARLLQKMGALLFDDEGRHDFSTGGFGYLLRGLASAFLVDQPVGQLLAGPVQAWPTYPVYEAFFAQQQPLAAQACSPLVGISVPMGPQLGPSLILAKLLKERHPQTRVVLGGPAISLMAAEDRELLLEACDFVDALVRFDGELPLLALVRQAQAQTWAPDLIAGVSGRREGKLCERPPAEGPDLQSLPFPRYEREILAKLIDPKLAVIQARGCYWGRCSYCDYVELYEGSPRFRTRRVEAFVDEMEFQIREHGTRGFTFITEAIPPGFAGRLADEVISRDIECTWNSFAMVDHHFDVELLGRMAVSGCEYLVVGMETMTDRVLELVKKAATQTANIAFLQAARNAGIRVQINLIPDLPSTTAIEARESLALFEMYRDCFTSVEVFPFEPTRSSEIGRNPEHFYLKIDSAASLKGQAQYASNHLPAMDPAMTPAERQEIHRSFRAFAAKVQGQHRALAPPLTDPEQITAAHSTRILWPFIDLEEAEGELHLFNALTCRGYALGAGWGRRLETLVGHDELLNQDMPRAFVEAMARMHCLAPGNLADNQLLMPQPRAAQRSPRPDRMVQAPNVNSPVTTR